MGLLKEVQKLNTNVNNSEEMIMKHIASGKHYLVHEVIHSSPSVIEHLANLFYENGYALKTISTNALDVKSMNREAVTLVFEKM